ncbi:hypothetical protein HCU74_01115 [Spongiibacter sp. KMU-166]|uniref:Hydroxyneurosporene synthase (CrtC) n=1 Tax=Spongiibacter thalassae TaxID=2721624 RepID=A0ABX1GA21_9GAMM|nr:hypothetical protein [Spongiibacter thalassae]NKI16007.1 hypothetical protein [Spongiibacter thalassae]
MKVSGAADLPVLPDNVNYWQEPVKEHNWQDSVVLTWWDAQNKIGGFHRIGHEPNYKDGPKIALWSHITAPEGDYKNVVYLDLREEDRLANGGFGAGETCKYEFIDGQHVWTINDAQVNAVIRHDDFHANVECYPKDSNVSEDFANVHTDIPGKVSGELTVAGKQYNIAGLSFRDRGWGVREWDYLLAHRWVAGTLGPDFSFLALSFYAADETLASFGWVVRGDTVTFAKAVDIVTYTEIDGMVNRGGHVRFELTTGEVFDIECQRAADIAFTSYHHDICCVDVLCEARCGDQVGFCDFESTANIQAGKRQPTRLVNSPVENGFHPR